MNNDKFLIFAHRGGSGYGLGNTVGAIMRSLALGLNIEIDVRACKNAIVITHYEALSAGKSQGHDPLKNFSLETVRQFGIAPGGELAWCPATVDGNNIERIPTLAEVFTLCKGKGAKIILDAKESDIYHQVILLIKRFGMENQVIYGVRSVAEANEIKKVAPELEILLFGEKEYFSKCIYDSMPASELENITYVRLWESWLRDANMLEEIHEMSKDILDKLHSTGKKVIVMAGDTNIVDGGKTSIGQIRKLKKELGADGIIVDDPALALEIE